ncbi:MAG: tetratricopeptide repeat protein [Anaeromyxobacter sp.]
MARKKPPSDRPRPAATAPAAPPASPARQWGFRLFTAVVLPLLALALLEGGLRLAGYGVAPGFTRPCEAAGVPSFCENPDFTRQFFPPALARRPSAFAFPREKGPRTARVFVVGESAAQGDPEPAFGVARFLQAMLEAALPGVKVEVVNAGVVAVNSHALLPIVRDLAGRGGDVVVVYAGNNEVVGPYGNGTVLTGRQPPLGLVRTAVALRSTRIGQLLASALLPRGEASPDAWRGMEMFLGQQVRADDPTMAGIYAAWEANLRDLVRAAREGGARVVVGTMSTRLRGFAPFASLHRPGLPAADLARWDAAVARGTAAADAGRAAEALAAFREAAAVDDGHAELAYRMAEATWALGDRAAARALYARARDLDTLRFRADSRENALAREVARAAGDGVALVDGEAAVDAADPEGLAGGALLWEHAHLTPEGNHALAAALLPEVVAALPADLRPAGAPAPLPFEACAARLAFTGFDRARVAREVLSRLSRPPFTAQLDHAAQVAAVEAIRARGAAEPPEEAEAAYRRALAAAPDDPWLLRGLARHLDALDDQAVRAGRRPEGRSVEPLRRALQLLPDAADLRQLLAEALLRVGRLPEAAREAEELLRRRPDHAGGHYTLGSILLRQNRTGDGKKHLERALALDPGQLGAHLELANLAAMRADGPEAARHLELAVRQRPDDATVQGLLVRLYELQGRRAEAAAKAREGAERLRAAGNAADAAALLDRARALEAGAAPTPSPSPR